MNSAHLHLALNHLPVLGLFFSLAILIAGRFCRNDTTLRVGLWLLLATALTALPAFLTGEPAEDLIERMPGIEKPLIEQHEDAAGLALGSALAAGLAAALVAFRLAQTKCPDLGTSCGGPGLHAVDGQHGVDGPYWWTNPPF